MLLFNFLWDKKKYDFDFMQFNIQNYKRKDSLAFSKNLFFSKFEAFLFFGEWQFFQE